MPEFPRIEQLVSFFAEHLDVEVDGKLLPSPKTADLPNPALWYHGRYERSPMTITASEARKNLFPLIEQVNDDRAPIEITSRRGDAVLMSRSDYDALEETAHLLRAPANARRLLESLAQAQSGDRQEHPLA